MAELCAPRVATDTLRRIASVESSFNPFAIGVVGGHLARQPRSKAEAVATANMLASTGYDYSVGIVQVNQKHFARYGISLDAAFDPCTNLRVGSLIFEDCQKRAGASPRALGDAISCYYSGNFSTGYRQGYVARVLGADAATSEQAGAIPVISDGPHHPKPQSLQQQLPVATSEGLFVSARPAPKTGVVVSDLSATKNGAATALLF